MKRYIGVDCGKGNTKTARLNPDFLENKEVLNPDIPSSQLINFQFLLEMHQKDSFLLHQKLYQKD